SAERLCSRIASIICSLLSSLILYKDSPKGAEPAPHPGRMFMSATSARKLHHVTQADIPNRRYWRLAPRRRSYPEPAAAHRPVASQDANPLETSLFNTAQKNRPPCGDRSGWSD